MMMNLFSIFDPSTSLMFSLNWLSMLMIFFMFPYQFWLIPSRYIMMWNLLMNFLFKEFKILINYSYWNLIIFLSLFALIIISNLMGLFPYIFTISSQLSFCLSLSSHYLIFIFWAYFHSSLAPSMEIGQLWLPQGIKPFNPFDIPLMNTIILISSGMTITWSHHSMLNKNFFESNSSLILTVMLGLYFTLLQIIEYYESPFSIADSIYGSSFFIATGFHGLHVIIGTMFLFICLLRMNYLHFSKTHHLGFEAAAWYWHFVDVIWLFLYISIYWWSY